MMLNLILLINMSFYSSIQTPVPNKSVFNLSHRNVTSMQFDRLYPTLLEETVPSDEFRIAVNSISRFAPQVSPAFGKVKKYDHFFYVPNRIVQPCWKAFISEDQEPTRRKLIWKTYHANWCVYQEVHSLTDWSSITNPSNVQLLNNWPVGECRPQVEVISRDGSLLGEQSLCDYLGIRPYDICGGSFELFDLTALIAYQFIYNEYYRDDAIEDDLFNIPYRHLWWLTSEGIEEFLRCLQGNGSVNFNKVTYYDATSSSMSIEILNNHLDMLLDGFLPLTSYSRQATLNNNVNFEYSLFEEIIHDLFNIRRRAWYKDYFTAARPSLVNSEIPIVPVQFNSVEDHPASTVVQGGDLYVRSTSTPSANTVARTDIASTVISTSTGEKLLSKLGFTISALRLANAIQKKEEKIMLFGKRYIEQLASRFGVISSDASLQRPQFLGGVQDEVYSNEISQTSESTQQSPQGNYSGQSIQASNRQGIKDFFCEEHGFICCLTSFLCETSYADGLDRKFTRSHAVDYYDPQFATLSDQQLLQKELKCEDVLSISYDDVLNTSLNLGRTIVENNDVFGYQGRWDEYRQRVNRFSAQMRDETSYWHYGRMFKDYRDLMMSLQYDSARAGGLSGSGGLLWKADGTAELYITGSQSTYNSSYWKVPLQWLTPQLRQQLYDANVLDDFALGTVFCVIDFNNPDQFWFAGFDWIRHYISPNQPKLQPSFIHSSVPTRSFAITDEFQPHPGNDGSTYLAGDDYIFCDQYFTISSVRPMPESSRPLI